jgi:tRNA(Ile)-lysidine synthase
VLLLHQPTYQPPDPAARYPHLPQLAADQLTLHVPGITPLSASWYAEASRTPPAHTPDPTNTLPAAWDWSVILDADTLDGPLLLRRRQPGDRFRPAGGRGSRRLQDLFVDSKLPRELRDRWPLLATPHSILWVAGLRADARFQPTPHTRHRLWITLRQHTDQQPGMEWAFQ